MSDRRNGPAFLFLAPFLVVFIGFFVVPIGYAIWLSLFGSSGTDSWFVGLDNYVNGFQDREFWSGVGRVLYFGAIQVPIMLLLALVLALVLDSPFAHARTFYRLVYFIPYAIPGVVAAIVWAYLYSPLVGPFQAVADGAGVPVSFLSSGALLYSIMVIVTWAWTGYVMTVFVAGLTSISGDLVEAARIDGASELRIALQIKVPLLRPLIIMMGVLSIIGTLQMFSEPYILSSLVAMPISYTPNIYIYNQAFSFGSFNYAAALAVILTAVTLLLSGIFLLATSRGRARSI